MISVADGAGQAESQRNNMRLFFALWPDADLRAALDAEAGRLHRVRGGRRTRAETIHLTLAFLGEVERARLPALLEMAAGIRVPRFEVRFDRFDCWRHNRVAHLGASQVPPRLLELVRQLEAGSRQLGLGVERRPYVPHITLLRHADCAPEMTNPAPPELRWLARDWVLVSSSLRSGGALYEQLGRWPLL